jgi:hypothetical protein
MYDSSAARSTRDHNNKNINIHEYGKNAWK